VGACAGPLAGEQHVLLDHEPSPVVGLRIAVAVQPAPEPHAARSLHVHESRGQSGPGPGTRPDTLEQQQPAGSHLVPLREPSGVPVVPLPVTVETLEHKPGPSEMYDQWCKAGQAFVVWQRHVDARFDRLDAQVPLAGWYATYGYVVVGAEFLDDGIPHVPMARPG